MSAIEFKYKILSLTWLLIFLSVSAVAQNGTGNNARAVLEIEDLYNKGEYRKADQRLELMLADENFKLTRHEEVTLYAYKARIAYAYGSTPRMQQWVRSIYALDPNYKLNPIQDPPEMLAYLAKLKQQKELPKVADKPKIEEKKHNQFITIIKESEAKVKKPMRFWIKTVPFGVGHFDSNRVDTGLGFLTAELALLIYAADLIKREKKQGGVDYNGVMFGTSGFLGLWGHEMWNLYPALYSEAPAAAEGFRFALSFAPLGVGQRKNGQITKAWVLGAIQVLGLLMATNRGTSQTNRNIGATVAGGAMIYGGIDGWLYHDWDAEPATTPAANLDLMPIPLVSDDGQLGLGLKLTYRFADD